MISVDFYILPDDQLENLQKYTCKLAEQHWQSGNRVLIQTDSADESHSIDELLWSLRSDSFIPHGIASLEPDDKQQPILISHQKINDNNFQCIINVSSRPADLNTDVSIEEILNQNETRKQSGRQNYKVYRDAGYTLKHHTLESVNG